MIDLTEIPSSGGFEFERFAEDLLKDLGWTIIIGAGKGPDGGRDVIASKPETTATEYVRHRRFVVQCKHNAGSGKSVNGPDIADFHLMPAKHRCEGWLLLTSTQLTADATVNIEAARSMHPQYEFDSWDARALQERVYRDECRKTFARYLPKSFLQCANVLLPSPAELRDELDLWIAVNEGL